MFRQLVCFLVIMVTQIVNCLPKIAHLVVYSTDQCTLLLTSPLGPSKTTRAYLHSEDKVRAALAANGFEIARSDLTASKFYFSRMLEAVRKN